MRQQLIEALMYPRLLLQQLIEDHNYHHKNMFEATGERDASGNVRYVDIGVFLRDRIKAYFREKAIEINLKYIDPSYMIRSLQANANDSVFCGFLGRDAVHAGMTGKTRMLVGHWNNHFVHVPMAVSARAASARSGSWSGASARRPAGAAGRARTI